MHFLAKLSFYSLPCLPPSLPPTLPPSLLPSSSFPLSRSSFSPSLGQIQGVSLRQVNNSAVNVSWSRLNSEDVSYRVYHFNPDGQATFNGNSSWGIVRGVDSQTQFQVVAIANVQDQDREGQRSELVCIGGSKLI